MDTTDELRTAMFALLPSSGLHGAPVHLPNADPAPQVQDPAPQVVQDMPPPAPQGLPAAQDAGTGLDAAPSPAPDVQHVEAVMEDADNKADGESPAATETKKKAAKPSHK